MELHDTGQTTEVWNDFWQGISPENEIRMWDFYGGRHWILKYVPRFGKTVEAGCGLGRYVFYLSELGLDIEGVDFSHKVVSHLRNWQSANGLDSHFRVGDVLNLPYPDESLSGYISLGVVEHFIDGPQAAIREVHRVLRPGGIAIITTPSVHFGNFYREKIRFGIRRFLTGTFQLQLRTSPFFQYWYRPKQLKRFIEAEGLQVVAHGGADLLYVFYEMGKNTNDFIKAGSPAVRLVDLFQNTRIADFGAQAITISVKIGEVMCCFFCGDFSAKYESLSEFDVPVCTVCERRDLAHFYVKHRRPKFNLPYVIEPRVVPSHRDMCSFCRGPFRTSHLFEDYGFTRPVCPDCLKQPEVNILLSNRNVKPIWRNRSRLR